jgi:CheY-specific phosphatase CheX
MMTDLTTPESLDTQIDVARQAFSIMADMMVFPATPAEASAAGTVDAKPTFTAVIRYVGDCPGSIRIECTPSIAFAFTERIMGISPAPEVFDSNVIDAIGELINIIGGNLKGLLPANTRLNTPEVFADVSAEEDLSLGMLLSCLHFESEFGAFRLVLHDTPAASGVGPKN